MARLTELEINTFVDEMKNMNNHINIHGKIKDSTYIKHFHTLNNEDWARIINVAVMCYDLGIMKLPVKIINDCEELFEIIKTYHTLGDNVLLPHPNLKHRLPKSLWTMPNSNETVKTVTWRAMVNFREAYCDMLGIYLPNEDSSIGLLDPKPRDQLFEF